MGTRDQAVTATSLNMQPGHLERQSKPGLIRHEEIANSNFHQPFLESKVNNVKAKGTEMLPPHFSL